MLCAQLRGVEFVVDIWWTQLRGTHDLYMKWVGVTCFFLTIKLCLCHFAIIFFLLLVSHVVSGYRSHILISVASIWKCLTKTQSAGHTHTHSTSTFIQITHTNLQSLHIYPHPTTTTPDAHMHTKYNSLIQISRQGRLLSRNPSLVRKYTVQAGGQTDGQRDRQTVDSMCLVPTPWRAAQLSLSSWNKRLSNPQNRLSVNSSDGFCFIDWSECVRC